MPAFQSCILRPEAETIREAFWRLAVLPTTPLRIGRISKPLVDGHSLASHIGGNQQCKKR